MPLNLNTPISACLLITAFTCSSQEIINAYAEVTAISDTILTIGNYNINNDQFEVGEQVILMQMQADVAIDGTNSPGFGATTNIGSAGLYEELTIQSITYGGTITLTKNLWSEDFEDLSTGATEDAGNTTWSISYGGGGTFRVDDDPTINGNSFVGRNLDVEGIWRSEYIDIAGYDNISISVDLAGIGLDASEYIRAYYLIDNGTEILFQNATGSFNNTTATVSNLNGDSLQVVIRMNFNSAREYGVIDNIAVQANIDTPSPSTISLSSDWVNTYEINSNSAVQLISFPRSSNYTTTDDLTALAWDGAIGGVFALDVSDTLTLNHQINVNGLGYRGGGLNAVAESTPRVCNPEVYRTDNGEYGAKGEGIYKNTTATYERARGRLANGGGGGSRHNSGGGGGGNFTAGGMGGPGYNESAPADGCDDDPSGDANTGAGGYGGEDLSDYISAQRIFMGGGGGGGQQDYITGDSEAGANGGGIVIIRANTVEVPCGSGITITANGDGFSYPGEDAGWEGAPGGGAGGTILFQVSNWLLTCSLQTQAMGGDGQASVYSLAHGGGGGGGKGIVIFSSAAPTTNFTSQNTQGDGGINGTSGSAEIADAGNINPSNNSLDPENDGIIETEEGPLPVQLLYWKASRNGSKIKLKWATALEIDNDYFTIEKSYDAANWEIISRISGHGNSSEPHEYELNDYSKNYKTVYYRLRQTDFDGKYELFNILVLQPDIDLSNLLLYPNPNNGLFNIQLSDNYLGQAIEVVLYDETGKKVPADFTRDGGILNFDFSKLPKGRYIIRLTIGEQSQTANVLLN